MCQRLEISPASIREQLAGQAPRSAASVDTPPALLVMPRAVAEAVFYRHDYIGTEHILMALLYVPDETAAQALARLGARESEVRAAVTAQRGPVRPRRGDRSAPP